MIYEAKVIGMKVYSYNGSSIVTTMFIVTIDMSTSEKKGSTKSTEDAEIGISHQSILH